MKRMCLVLLAALVVAGCQQKPKLTVLSQRVGKQLHQSSAVPNEYAQMTPSSEKIFWVEGEIRNDGTEPANNVVVSFHATDGAQAKVMYVEIPSIQPGQTVAYKTRPLASHIELTLTDEEPDFEFKR